MNTQLLQTPAHRNVASTTLTSVTTLAARPTIPHREHPATGHHCCNAIVSHPRALPCCRTSRARPKDPGPREDGASFLAMKQTLLLSYCRELCAYVAAKGRGVAMKGGGAAGRLMELRVVMEKLRPLDRWEDPSGRLNQIHLSRRAGDGGGNRLRLEVGVCLR